MADLTIYHNPACSTSRHAMEVVAGAGVEADVVQYLKTPLDAEALRVLIGRLEDPPSDLVRRDGYFKEQGLTPDDVATVDQIVDVLVAHPRLMQRPVLVRGDRAVIGRPKERVAAFVGA